MNRLLDRGWRLWPRWRWRWRRSRGWRSCRRCVAAQAHQWALARDLGGAVRAAGGREAVLACGRPYVGPYRGPLMAYALRVTKRTVEPDARRGRPAWSSAPGSRHSPAAPAPGLPGARLGSASGRSCAAARRTRCPLTCGPFMRIALVIAVSRPRGGRRLRRPRPRGRARRPGDPGGRDGVRPRPPLRRPGVRGGLQPPDLGRRGARRRRAVGYWSNLAACCGSTRGVAAGSRSTSPIA